MFHNHASPRLFQSLSKLAVHRTKPGLDDLGKPLRLMITVFIELQEKIQGKVPSKLLKKLICLLKTTSQDRPWIDDKLIAIYVVTLLRANKCLRLQIV